MKTLNLINNLTIIMNNNIISLHYILCTIQLQPYHKSMATKQSPNTSTFIEEEPTSLPLKPHGNPDVAPTSAHSYVVPKYVTDVATLISASEESRKMFLTEVTKACLEAAKKTRSETNKPPASQRVQIPTNTNTTGTKTIYSSSLSGNPTSTPAMPYFRTSDTTMNKRVEEENPTQTVTLFAPVGVAEDLSKTQYLLCGEIKEELKSLKQSIADISFQELSKQLQELTRNLETRMCTLELNHKALKDIILQRNKQQSQLDPSLLERWDPS